MASSIESRIVALLDASYIERIPELLEKYFEENTKPINWTFVDEFGQPILLRIVETGTVDVVTAILKHVPDTAVQETKYVLFYCFHPT
jgi:hypothetical protein